VKAYSCFGPPEPTVTPSCLLRHSQVRYRDGLSHDCISHISLWQHIRIWLAGECIRLLLERARKIQSTRPTRQSFEGQLFKLHSLDDASASATTFSTIPLSFRLPSATMTSLYVILQSSSTSAPTALLSVSSPRGLT
jgi:hypothetical protein